MWRFDAARIRSVFKSRSERKEHTRTKPSRSKFSHETLREKLPLLKFSREAPHETLSRGELQLHAMRNIRLIAILGLLLILADLVLSLAGPDYHILKENGSYYLLRPAAGEASDHIPLRASVRTEDSVVTSSFDVRLDPQQNDPDKSASDASPQRQTDTEDLILSELRSVAAGFNDDLASRKVLLPSVLTSGEPISWSIERSSNVLLIALMTAALSAVVYRGRFQPLHKLEQKQQQSVQKHLPVFLNELVLLMGAGLVLSRAFESAVQSSGEDSSDYFYSGLRRICHSIRNTNAVMHEELRSFSKESGVSEFMRVSSIISDNINKGSELTEKLELEMDSLWNARRLHAQQRGRLAETKMTIPLAIFLCVLIIITVAPAMMQL